MKLMPPSKYYWKAMFSFFSNKKANFETPSKFEISVRKKS